jgi:isoleucyl-tRNA synthetase
MEMDALSERAKAGIKVRQPLAKIRVTTAHQELQEYMVDIIKEEVNVKEVGHDINPTHDDVAFLLDTTISPELKREGQMREVIRQVQNARKNAELQVDDRIALNLYTGSSELARAIDEHKATIASETLAKSLKSDQKAILSHKTTVKIDGAELMIELQKA